MAGTKGRIRKGLTLEEFLQLPEEKPYLEYIDGRIEAKVSPKRKHVTIQHELVNSLNAFARPDKLGQAFSELRCTFAGRSIVPDVVYQHDEHIDLDEMGEQADDVFVPPDLHVEVISPDQTLRKAKRNLMFSMAHGCRLGWLIHPYKKTVTVFRPDQEPQTLGLDGTLNGADVLPGFELPLAELFGWLKPRPVG
jgi:Uma2 family endonuclease